MIFVLRFKIYKEKSLNKLNKKIEKHYIKLNINFNLILV